MMRIAFYTFGILQESRGHEQVQGFFDRVNTVMAQAGRTVGFMGVDDGTWGPMVYPGFFDERKHSPPQITLSLWADLESVCAFAYRGAHADALKKRRDWALDGEWPSYVAWWVAADHVPTPEEGSRRLERLHEDGPTGFAFDFKKPFDERGRPRKLDRELFQTRVEQSEAREP